MLTLLDQLYYFVKFIEFVLQVYSEEVVIAVATAIAVLDVFFIMVAVPESLPDKCKPSKGSYINYVARSGTILCPPPIFVLRNF